MMESTLDRQIAARVRRLRSERAITLEALAEKSGVSRSMLSLIERGETSATAVTLEKVAGALDISLAALFDVPAERTDPVSRHADQVAWRDPASGYVRRNVSPGGFPSPIQIVEIAFPPGARVAYEATARQTPVPHQVWVLEGSIEVSLGEHSHRLATGDCLAFLLDRPVTYQNRTRKAARYAVVIAR
jgi:transcriptional regulator with XRE-family HTH domain